MTIPFWCIAIAFVLIYVPKIPLSVAMARQPEGYDNKHPRAQQAKLTGWGARSGAAHQNGFEAFAPFAAAVLVAHVGGGDPAMATILSLVFVGARAVYIGIYLAGGATLRSLVWSVGFGATAALMVLPAWAPATP